jgi:hypothetical protein
MKITWWGWLIILYVAYWWLKKNGYLNKMGRVGNSPNVPDLDAVCRRAENFEDCFDCLMNGNGDTQRANIIATEAEGKCLGWGFVRKNNTTTF